ncbi:hypothetical protein [Ottowia testudinis]|nr:hypothetical protein [Ottowia testudinis]QTD45392.1 hypothetical protein J1M35_00210 [Ottowia testudinis]QTD45394.1 hypothetical protein J1M35_00220 [Ottowia testudinis]
MTNGSFTATIPANTSGFKVEVAASTDTITEGSESFTLSAQVGSTTAVAGTGTITDATAALAVSTVSSPTAAEGNNLVFDVALNGSSTSASTATVTLTSGTATIGTDTGTVRYSTDGGTT